MRIKTYAGKIFSSWVQDEIQLFESYIEPGKRLLDMGCSDGKLTTRFAQKARSSVIWGIDGIFRKLNNVHFMQDNLNHKWKLPSNSFDVVISHFSLEHLYNTGVFIKETKRVLKKGGYTLVATDNLSSWPNVISLFFGWQPFTTAGGIADMPLGNPIALGNPQFAEKGGRLGEFSHNKVMAYQQLYDAYRHFGFDIEIIRGVGYFPFGGALSRLFCSLDPRHAHLLILKARKSR